VIGVGVGDDGAFDWFPRVDIKIALLAVKTTVRESYQPAFFHSYILHNRESGTCNAREM
jgi:hypothetical protein